LTQAESQDFLANSSSKECGSLSSLPKTVLWKRFNQQLTAGGRDWEKRGGPSGSPRCEGLSYIHTHKISKALYCCVKSVYIANALINIVHIFIYINTYTYTDNKGLTLWQEKKKQPSKGKQPKTTSTSAGVDRGSRGKERGRGIARGNGEGSVSRVGCGWLC